MSRSTTLEDAEGRRRGFCVPVPLWRAACRCWRALRRSASATLGHLLGSGGHRGLWLTRGRAWSARWCSAATWAILNQPLVARRAGERSRDADCAGDRVDLRRPPARKRARGLPAGELAGRSACNGRSTAAAIAVTPSFAVGPHAGDALLFPAPDHARRSWCTGHEGFPVYVDSPHGQRGDGDLSPVRPRML